jgi:hypothetical protein
MSEDERRRKARETAELRYWLRWHLLIYAIVNAGFVGIWYFTETEGLWPLFSLGFWGIGLIAHYLIAYHRFISFRFISYGKWIEKETEKILKDME